PTGSKEATVGYVERHLLPDEQVLYKTRLHWILLLRPSMLIALSLVTVAIAWRMDAPPAVWYVGGAAAVAGLLCGLVHYIEMMTSGFDVHTVRLNLKVCIGRRYQ